MWIGARTTVNPFSVQEIADSIKGIDVPILIKNPIHADLQLWIGAIERVLNTGNKKVAAIHRGFHSMNTGVYRYDPDWQIPIQLKTFFPNLPLICDPSHISGKSEIVKEVSQRAMDLLMDGLMIETHAHPDKAWSDAAQQITTNALKQLCVDLKVRKESDDADEYNQKLAGLRTQIDELDAKLINVLAKRMKIADAIGMLKKERNVAVLQSNRWNEVLGRMILDGEEKGLSEEFVLKLFKAIHQESISHQEKVFKKD